jgi:hypothetical protein
MSAVLHQPKWRKFLSLKRERKAKSKAAAVSSEPEADVHDNASTEASRIVETAATKKRKRSEEEIALRKAKKLNSKNKQAQEWTQLSENHQALLSSKSEVVDGNDSESGTVEKPTETVSAASSTPPALLSIKAKEIAKAQRDEKVIARQKQENNRGNDISDLDKKSTQILEYLDQYRAHIDSGSIWKFKKQYQNWIVKHLYSFPWKSDELVIRYLRTVQGQARERLIAEATKMIEDTEGEHGEAVIHRAENVIEALSQ